MRKTKSIKKLLTAITVTVLGTAFTVSSAACAHQHVFSSGWTANSTAHWHAATCQHTDEISGLEAHEFGDDDVCDICNYNSTLGAIPTDPSAGITVSFETMGGTPIANKTVNKNDTVTVDDPVRSGYTFAGWYSDEDLTIPFIMGTTKVTESITLYAHWTSNGASADVKKTFTVTFNSNGGSSVEPQTVNEGHKAVKPSNPEYAGHQFVGWYSNSDCSGTAYGFTGPVQGNLTLYAKWEALSSEIKAIKSYNESLAVEWSDGAPSQASVQYKAVGASSWLDVDSELIRAKSGENSVARVDIVGISAGEYDVKITPSGGANAIQLAPITVTAHDRSGYAHFQRKSGEAAYEGIGAYKDDGTLKDNAIVIYVTEQNKDTVMDDIAAKYSAVNMFKIPNHFTNKWGNKNASGIGWWLNNAQYSKAEKDKNGNVIQNKSSNTYDPAGNKLGFANPEFNCPVVLRFIGTVTTPEGCTEFNSLNEGGSVGDNGHMARMKNFKNITLEGIGEDAVIEGWGFHFMRGNDATGDFGTSFEARNLTFNAYPEDALGMEGVQGKSGGVEQITASVERCWVHNNTFLPGHCASPAESDKKEGDGSCDFKRGMYYTLSYNIFEYCHKTNLVGSSDDSLQYNVTMHHNMWYNCGSRIPLLRQANIHFYNNFVFADATDPNAGGEKGLSYVHSLRANCYMFSEANYYDGCKQVTDGKNGGDAKGWNNMFVSCFKGSSMVPAQTREEVVDNKCQYLTTSFKTFDTDPALFYYDSTNHVSDCLLDDAVTARSKVILNAGANGTGAKNLPLRFNGTTLMNKYVPTAAVDVPDEGELNIDVGAIGKAKKDTEQHGILFRGLSGETGGAMKFKGQGVTFTLAAEAAVTVTATTIGDNAPTLISANGSVIAKFEGTLQVTLPAGTYVLVSGQKDKDSNISKLSFASTAGSAQAKIDNLNAAIDALPATVTLADGTLVKAAQTALAALNQQELSQYEAENAARIQKLNNAVAAYSAAQVNNVKALIDAIGTVNGNSYPAIEAARTAYDALTATQKSQVTNYSALTAAESAWANIAVSAVNAKIADLKANYGLDGWTKANGETAITEMKAKYTEVKTAYDALSSDQKTQITEYASVVTAGITKLDGLLAEIETDKANAAKLADFRAALAEITDVENSTLAQLSPVVAKYKALGALTGELTSDEQTKYTSIETKHTALAAEEAKNTITVSFNGSKVTCSSEASTIGLTTSGSYKTGLSIKINNETYTTGLKFQSSAGEIHFTLPTDKTLTIYVQSADISVNINGTKTAKATAVTKDGYTSVYAITVEVKASVEYTIKKGDGEAHVLLLEFTKPAETSTASLLEDQIDLAEAKQNQA